MRKLETGTEYFTLECTAAKHYGITYRSVENGGGGMHSSWTTEIENFLQFYAFNERHGVR